MRVALDGMPLASQLTGVGHYTFELARSLKQVAPDDEFTFVSPDSPGVRHRQRWWSLGLPLYLVRKPFDLFHGTNYEIPIWSRLPSVVTIHDLSLFFHPEAHEKRLVRRARWRMPLMARLAARIITPTASVKKEVAEKFGLNPDKIAVTHEAPRATFKRREDAELLQRLAIREPFVLFVGTIEPRKNLHRLVEAFDRVLRTTSLSPQLVIAGGQGWLMDDFAAAIRQRGLEDHVCLAGYLKDEELSALYSSCKVFVYPSLYEGFGLPPLEAMACGAPVIASEIAAIKETLGDAARLIDPRDVDDLAQAMVEMLSDEEMREHFARAGSERVKQFTWEKTALETLKVYRDVV